MVHFSNIREDFDEDLHDSESCSKWAPIRENGDEKQEKIEFLVKSGTDLKSKNDLGKTPLHEGFVNNLKIISLIYNFSLSFFNG
jgi:hypothetical protein